MSTTTVKLSIPFESLLESIHDLAPEDKLRLWELLNQELAQLEEELLEANPRIQAELREARAAYAAGQYVTIEEYITQAEATEESGAEED